VERSALAASGRDGDAQHEGQQHKAMYDELVEGTEGFSGADIEQCVIEALQRAYLRWKPTEGGDVGSGGRVGAPALTEADLHASIEAIKPTCTGTRIKADPRLNRVRGMAGTYALDAYDGRPVSARMPPEGDMGTGQERGNQERGN